MNVTVTRETFAARRAKAQAIRQTLGRLTATVAVAGWDVDGHDVERRWQSARIADALRLDEALGLAEAVGLAVVVKRIVVRWPWN